MLASAQVVSGTHGDRIRQIARLEEQAGGFGEANAGATRMPFPDAEAAPTGKGT